VGGIEKTGMKSGTKGLLLAMEGLQLPRRGFAMKLPLVIFSSRGGCFFLFYICTTPLPWNVFVRECRFKIHSCFGYLLI
jgi:hypothetical protein